MAGMARIAFCPGKLIPRAYMGIDPLASGNMTKVGKSDCERTFAAMRRDDEDAPTDPMGVRIATGALPE